MNRPIALVEPQMEGLFHAPSNAALLHAVALAYPDAPVSFRAFPEHQRVVRSILEQHAPELIERIEWRSIPLPVAKSMPARWRQSGRVLREALASGERVFFCSVSRMQLLQLKRTMRDRDEVRVLLHGDLDRIAQPPWERFPMSLFALHRILLRPHPRGLKYILLGESIRNNIPEEFRHVFANAGVIDHPYHFPPVKTWMPGQQGTPIFGILGNTGDGRLLEDVASRVKSVAPDIRFRLVGFLSGQAAVERLRPFVEEAGDQPIARDVFIERAESITHALWLAPPNSFQLRASGTFFDALAYAKPLVYTANSFIDPYFELEPDIGVRCETAADVPGAILKLAAGFTSEKYAVARAAIERLRARFTPQELAKTLHESLGWD